MPVVQIYRRFILLEHLQIIPLDLTPFHRLAHQGKKVGKDMLQSMPLVKNSPERSASLKRTGIAVIRPSISVRMKRAFLQCWMH